MKRLHHLKRVQTIPKPLDEVFDFFADAANLQALTPPFLHFTIQTPLPITMAPGVRLDYKLSLFGVPFRWRTHITEWEHGAHFVDEQEHGPYALWRHLHQFEALNDTTTRVRDSVEYVEPLGPLGLLAHHLFVKNTLERIFDYRQLQIQRLLDADEALKEPSPQSFKRASIGP